MGDPSRRLRINLNGPGFTAGAGRVSSTAAIGHDRGVFCRSEVYASSYHLHPAARSGLGGKRHCFQAIGLPHTSPGHSSWVHGPVFPVQATGLLYSIEVVALGVEEG